MKYLLTEDSVRTNKAIQSAMDSDGIMLLSFHTAWAISSVFSWLQGWDHTQLYCLL